MANKVLTDIRRRRQFRQWIGGSIPGVGLDDNFIILSEMDSVSNHIATVYSSNITIQNHTIIID